MKSRARTEREDERRQRRIRVAISVFMLFILVFSSVAYFFTPDPNSFSYNGIRFRAQADSAGFIQGYVAKVDGEQRSFFTRPTDTLSLALPEGFPESLRDAQVVVVLFDPADNLTPLYDVFRFELEKTLGTSPMLVPAVTTESEQYAFPVYSCAQAAPGSPVILLTQGTMGIAEKDGCIVVAGGQYDFALLLDRIRYRLLGVTEE